MTERVIVEHEDGRRYSVTREAAGRVYPDFQILGEETAADFDVDVPAPKARRSHARKKSAAPIEPEAE